MSEPSAGKVLAWAVPRVDGPVLGQRRLADLGALEREAWDQGYAAGETAGRAVAAAEQQRLAAELRERVARLDQLLALQATPLADLDASVFRQLATLAAAIARQLVRRELRAQPEQIIAVIRDTVALLPVATRDVRIHLHPQDAALVREQLAMPAAERAWTLVEDPVVARGGCRIHSENSSIDAQVETRLGAAIAAVLGDERAGGAGGAGS
jgi:flagellar assembly protein FliH